MSAGNNTFIHSMMESAGFINSQADKDRYPAITIDDMKQSPAEYILLSSEPYPFSEKHKSELEQLLPGKKIILVDGELFSWYGSRMLLAPAYFKKLHHELQSN